MKQMHKSDEEFGLEVKKEKTAMNFDVVLAQGEVLRGKTGWFSYCGMELDTRTLEIRKTGRKDANGKQCLLY